MTEQQGQLPRADGTHVAWRRRAGRTPTVMFCGGFMSDMAGTKARALDAQAAAVGRSYVRFDYRGHGESGGAFADGSIGDWADDALAVLDNVAAGPVVLVGSSMGAWIAGLLIRQRPGHIAGLVTVAAAPDFVMDLLEPGLTAAERRALAERGRIEQPSDYGDGPYVITRHLIEEASGHRLLDRPVPLAGPARLIHGDADPDVPWTQSVKLMAALAAADVTLTLVKGGDHRLSRPEDLGRLTGAVDEVCRLAAAPGG